ncbi:hypothetical protein H311_00166 [Anncaliia algerae PRA109]|nr:hypothetical protein H311_00166 [Anncaliia algerae PRA109]
MGINYGGSRLLLELLLSFCGNPQDRKLGFKSQANNFLSKDIKYLNKKLPPQMIYNQMNKLHFSTSSLKTVSLYLKHLLHNVYPCDQDTFIILLSNMLLINSKISEFFFK